MADTVTMFPLSPAQLGMWYAQLLDPGVPLSEAQYIEMRGRLDLDQLRRAGVTAAREFGSGVLRLLEIDGRPQQVVDARLEPTVEYLDLRDRPDPFATALAWMRRDVAAPIDLFGAGVGISVVIHIGVDHYLWYTRAHHILIDGFGSVTMLYRVAELYNATVRGELAKPGTAASLLEVHEAEMAYRDSTRAQTDARYWREQVAGMPRRCSLVSTTAPASVLGREQRGALSPEVSARLDITARRFGTTSATLVMAAVALYYARLTASEDVVLSLPVSGRTTAMLRRSGGMVANVVPLRIPVRRNGTVGEVVDAVRMAASGALRHQRYRHEDMREREGDGQEYGRGFVGPVVNIMLFATPIDFVGLESSMHVLTSGPIEDLFVNFYQYGAEAPIHVDFAANPVLYEQDSLVRHHRRFMTLFDSLLAASPETAVAQLNYFTSDEAEFRHGIRGVEPPAPRLLSEILAAGARRAGDDAVAVVCGAREVTYGELEVLSNRLARRLIGAGIGPESAVLVALPRSVAAMVAIWAVAKSGAAFVPVGTGLPGERVARMAAECAASIGLTSTESVAGLPDSVVWLALDEPSFAISGDGRPPHLWPRDIPVGPIAAAERNGTPRIDNAAYIVFTSGSTGVPKGVMVTHAGLAGLAAAVADSYQVMPDARVLQCLNPSFDASILEWLMAFASGATLVVAAADPVLGADLAALIRDYRVTQLCSTPAVLSTVAAGALDGVRAVSSGGESCPPELVARFGVGRTLLNSYGPTETTVAVTFTDGLVPGEPVGMGVPVPGVELLVLDRWLRAVPTGIVGELYVLGPGVARGYAGRPGLSAERFVAAPSGARMYRTGDLVRRKETGALEYVGRNDFQVKLRGIRIELGEIDAVLAAHAAVEIAVTVARPIGAATMLAAYVVPVVDASVTEAELIEHVAQRLPAYMVPATVSVLGALPLTGNGKIDRGALPEPVVDRSVRALDAITAAERAMCALFSEVLGTPDIGPDSSFFALGGDSIMAIQLVAGARAAGLVFSARDVFERRTPAALAAIATELERPATLPELPGGGVGSMPLTPIAAWLLARPGWERFAQSMVVRLPVGIEREQVVRTVQAVFDRHDMLRSRLVAAENGWELSVSDIGAVDVGALLTRVECDAVNMPDRAGVEPGGAREDGSSAQGGRDCAPGGAEVSDDLHVSGTAGLADVTAGRPDLATDSAEAAAEGAGVVGGSAGVVGGSAGVVGGSAGVVGGSAGVVGGSAGVVGGSAGVVGGSAGVVGGSAGVVGGSAGVVGGSAGVVGGSADFGPGRPGTTAVGGAPGVTDQALAAAVQRLDPVGGVMAALTWLDGGAEVSGRLVIVLHHLVCDAVSWRILLPDLMSAWAQADASGEPYLLEVGTSVRTWADALRRAAEKPVWTEQFEYWRGVLAADPVLGRRRLDPAVDTQGSAGQIEVDLPVAVSTAIVQRIATSYRCGVEEALLAALAVAVSRWRRVRGESDAATVVTVERHGREEAAVPGADLSRTVGWFTAPVPVRLGPIGSISVPSALKMVKEQVLSVPDGGFGFGLLRYVNAEAGAGLAAEPVPQIGVNYLGQLPGAAIEGDWMPVSVATRLGGHAHPDSPLAAVVSVDAAAVETAQGVRITALWQFASAALDRSSVDSLVREWVSAATEIAEHLMESDAGGLTPADVRLVEITQSEIDTWEKRYGRLDDIWPLSPLQRGLFFLAQLAEGGPDGYSVQAVIDVEAELDVDRMRAAAAELLRRHDALRAAFVRSADAAVQPIAAAVELPWTYLDAPNASAAQLDELAAADLRTPFAVDQPPLIRFTCIALGSNRFRLVITNHHLVLDGWSMPLLFGELVALYETGSDSTGFGAPVPYRDYLAWISTRDTAAARDAWAKALAGLAGPTLVAPSAPRAERAAASVDHEVPLPQDLAEKLRDAAAEYEITVNTIVQVAWALLLAERTGPADIVFGATVSGRPPALPGAERMIGMLVNTIAVRITLDPGEPIAELLARVQREQSALAEHHLLGLDEIQAHAGLGPLFDTATVFESYPIDAAALAEATSRARLSVTGFRGHDGTHYPLSLATYAASGLRLVLTRSPRYFEAAEAAAMSARLSRILSGIVADPSARTARVPGIDGGVGWDGPPSLPPTLLPNLLRGNPESAALKDDRETLTYAQLDERSNRLARLLIQEGARPESAVLIGLPRSVSWMVTAWAIAKTGAAFVAVDIAQPAARIAAIAAECGARLCVTVEEHRALAEALPSSVPMSWVILDEISTRSRMEAAAAGPVTSTELLGPVRTDQAAYLVFTSGSTGTPKGVVITHAGLADLAAAAADRCAIGPGARVLHCHNPGFDASILVWLATFAAGATLMVAPPEANAGTELAAAIRAGGVTHIFSTPAVLATLPTDALRGVEVVVTGGESCPSALVTRIGTGRMLVNSYGPAETTVAATFTGPIRVEAVAAIGAPVPGVTLVVLDGWLRPVTAGMTGELYVRGPGLARGYAGRAGLSANRFVADPFASGQRMYRTGDLVRSLDGPEFEYVGRGDAQVKVRGIRIEPGEIDAALLAHPDIDAAVTVARRDRTGALTLCSYVTAQPGSAPTAARLTAWLTARLPRYLVPQSIRVLAALPRTRSGKIDLHALPEVEVAHAEYIAPVGTERIVAAAFAQVLAAQRVGSADDFFALGGDSLSATRVVARIGGELGTTVPVRLLFEASVVSDLARRLDTDRSHSARPALVRAQRPELIPLSPAQQRMWLINRYDPDSPAYNVPAVLRLTGGLDIAALRMALADVLDRHESLRTIYPDTDGVGSQYVLDADAVAVELAPAPVRPEQVPEAVLAEITVGFDVTAAVPVRLRLFRLAEDEHVVVVVGHHIAIDGFSMGPLTRDLAMAYAARSAGRAPEWQPLTVQYADYTLWQHAWLGSEHDPDSPLARQLDHWSHTLAELPDHLELPTDRPRPAHASHRAAEVVRRIDDDLIVAIERLASDHNATPFMVMHAALALLLGRASGASDIAIGTPVAGRGASELDDLVGMFVNTLVLRTGIRAAESFSDLLDRVRGIDVDAFDNADVPFERLVDLLAPTRSAARHPLFQVMLVYQNLGHIELTLPELTVAPIELDRTISRFDLSVTVSGSDVRICYATDLFDAPTVERFAERLIRILVAVTTDRSRAVGDIDIRTPDERMSLLSAGVPAAGRPKVLADLLAEAVAMNPDGIAVVATGKPETEIGGNTDEAAPIAGQATDSTADALNDRTPNRRQLTYRELDEQSNRLARGLIDAGAGPETLVAVGIPRSIESIVAVWAIAKSGAAFVPVDPAYPPDRIARIVDVSGVNLGLTVTDQLHRLPDAVSWFALDDPATVQRLAAVPDSPIADADRIRPPHPQHPAYVIFTSGSTGAPKGVVVTHTGLANLAVAQRDRNDITAESRVLHVASPSFDASVLELLLAVGAAACLVVAPPEIFAGAELSELVSRERVSHLSMTPSALATVDPTGLDELRVIITGGEPCPPDLVAAWAAPRRRHFNDYGPTETTVWATGTAPLVPDQPVTIGAPAPGFGVLVLDERLHPVPDGVPGELYLSGSALARGYHGRGDLTAARFVANPHGGPGERIYRTGDLVRARRGMGSAVLEYLGRTDNQVKLRGLRIELGDIEAALTSQPAVGRAAALIREGGRGNALLVAYVVAASPIDPGHLKRAVAQKLPSYMVPSAIVVLDALPRTANGKLDRAALPAPDTTPGPERPPTTPLERAVAAAFEAVLDIEQIWLDDDFFALGGNSLIATRLVARLGAVLDVSVPVRALFDAPTVAELAELVGSGGLGARSRPGPRPRPERIPLSAAQQRMWFLNRYDPRSPVYNIPGAFEIQGALDISLLRAAIDDVVTRHETLRTIYPVGPDGIPYQRILPAATGSTPVTESAVQPTELTALLAAEISRGFDVTTEPPLRVTVLRLAAEHTVLVLVAHHIAADGWSMAPLARDVMHAFAAHAVGRSPDWTPLPLQYADYALWQHDLLGADDDPDSLAHRQLDFWRNTLRGLPEVHALPTDHPRTATLSRRGDRIDFDIPAAAHERLRTLARQHGASVFMTVHAALAVLLARLSGETDIAIGSVVAGRGDGELDDLVGMFVNTLVLRSSIDSAQSFATILDATRRSDLTAYGNMDVPFERIVDALAPTRATAYHPLFQVLLAFQNVPQQRMSLPGLDIRPVPMSASGSKFDLEWMLVEQFDDAAAPAGITASLTYAADLFEHETAAAMAHRFLRLIEAVAAAPTTVVGDIDLLGSEERAAVLHRSRGATRVLAPATLVDLFDEQVARTPDATAWIFVDATITYRDFDRRVTRLARLLIERGIGPDAVVAVPIGRSIDLMTALYAVLKAGAAYVPVDVDHPAERIAQIIESAAPACVLVSSKDRVVLPETVPLIEVDTAPTDRFDDGPIYDGERTRHLRPADLCWVVYTSGSTGTPKGVAVTHAAMANQLRWIQQTSPLGAGDRLLHKTPITFDIAGWEIFGPLQTGAAVVVAEPGGHRDPHYLARLIREQRVTAAHFVPSALAAFLADPSIRIAGCLEHVYCAGEALPGDLVARFAAISSARVHNLYGPAEATVATARSDIADDAGPFAPIGQPVWNSTAYVLDSRMHPVQDGCVGELYLGGVQIARGYYRRAGLTAERFVANPFGPNGSRLYRTGDLAHWTTGGSLVYDGRVDFQVKVRGQRIELAEIEHALVSLDVVRDAVAIAARDDHTGDRIVAYLVPQRNTAILDGVVDSGALKTGSGVMAAGSVAAADAGAADLGAVDAATVRAAVARLLPPYMVPAAIMIVPEFPLNANGKLDRQALPAPIFEAAQRPYRAPESAAECALATAFETVLGTARVGLDDNFFDLGGNSMVATRLVAEVRERTGLDMPVQWMFTEPTPAALAQRLTEAVPQSDIDAAMRVLLPMRGTGSGPALICVHPAIGLAWCYTGLLRYLDDDHPVYGLQSPGVVDGGTADRTVRELALRYLEEIRRVRPHGPYRLLGYSAGGPIAHAMAVELRRRGEEVPALIMLDSRADVEVTDDAMPPPELLLAEFGGVVVPPDGEAEFTPERAAQLLREAPGAFGGFTATDLGNLYRDFGHLLRQVADYRPEVFDGDLLFVGADTDYGDEQPNVSTWRPYIGGRIHDHPVDFGHNRLTTPEAYAVIGPLIADYLRRR
ncbi:amino acid adenylation domain-containing protein [Nocardia sp. CA-129566]|uniref:amino acid adenylation domain-containing protein n=1 Tax=Nocardia sp. CA-129566 TaxID=3239976 RepID=UPI003D990B82